MLVKCASIIILAVESQGQIPRDICLPRKSVGHVTKHLWDSEPKSLPRVPQEIQGCAWVEPKVTKPQFSVFTTICFFLQTKILLTSLNCLKMLVNTHIQNLCIN